MSADTFTFEIDKFDGKRSKIHLLLIRMILAVVLWLLISLTTQNQYIEDWYIILPYLLPAILIVFPDILKVFRFLPIVFLKLSSPKLDFLSKIPMVEFSGIWFVEEHSELIEFNSPKSILKFFTGHWFSLFILPFSSFLMD